MVTATDMETNSAENERRTYGIPVSPTRKTILVVDDSEVNRHLMCRILRTEYDTIEAENGLEALSILRQYGSNISLVLLDLIMPIIDGYAFMKQWKSDSLLSGIPVVVTTQSDCDNDEINALSAGASDFITKPYKPKIIMHRIANIIKLRETAAIMNLLEYDQLTGVYSKEFFYRQAKSILEQNPDTDYDIICGDIENFKLVNDSYGVSVGDDILRGVAKMSVDYVMDKGICGRLGADVFVCLVERSVGYVEKAFETYIERLNKITSIKNLTMKFGVYQIRDISLPVSAMCDRAILAVESIKGKFGKLLAHYNDEIIQKLLFEQTITESMETALSENQFKVYLQPKFNINTNSISGAEALVRWFHPEKGFLSPGEFIPLFEKNGFVSKLDQYMWENTCRIIRGWIDAGIAPVPVSVNVSRTDIYNLDLPETILGIIRKYELEPWMLHLEITESAYTENPKQIIEATTKLRSLGFIIEMDDFGTGYSSLNMLSELPIDILKLDIRLIQSSDDDSGRKNILNFIISMAKWMNLLVIAEGVETEEQVSRLKYMNCDYAQGYFYARPMPENDFLQLFTSLSLENETVNYGVSCPLQEINIIKVCSNDRVMLIVDDLEINRSILRETFSPHYCIAEAGSGDGAIKYLKKNSASVDIILLGLAMSVTDGFELLSLLKHDDTICDIPVIIASQPGDGKELKAYELGADGFVAKPYIPEVVFHHVQNLTDLAAYRRQQKQFDLQNELLSEVYHDYLTGTLNRRGFEKAAAEIRFPLSTTMHALYMLDLDNFKQCNDTYGHIHGDRLLKSLGTVFEQSLRSDDIVARIGGDEFVIIMKNMSSPYAALSKGKRLCIAVHDCENSIDSGFVSCSIGIALLKNGDDIEEVLELADRALYAAKRDCKGNCCICLDGKFFF